MKRLVGLASAVLILVVPALVAVGPPAAAVKQCTIPVFFGLHGINEGPSTYGTAEDEGFDYYQNQISGGVFNYGVPYYRDSVSLFNLINPPPPISVPKEVAKLMLGVNDGENQLQSAIDSYKKGCTLAQLNIALVGYSMGAWVINKWLNDHPGEWILIKAVVLYGDPCWVDGSDQGLIRAVAGAGVAGLVGCSSAKTYPYPAPQGIITVPFLAESWCVGGDPVAGCGFGSNLAKQIPAALACLPPNTSCPHLWYRVGRPAAATLKYGAQFVVQQLIGSKAHHSAGRSVFVWR